MREDDNRVATVSYLERAFSEHSVEAAEDLKGHAYQFVVEDTAERLLVHVAWELFNDASSDELLRLYDRNDLAGKLRSSATKHVLVTAGGIGDA